MQKTNKRHDYVQEEISFLKRGIDLQREYYKRANLENNTPIMVKALENIKSEVKQKALAKGKTQQITRIEKILSWYYQLPLQYTRATPTGKAIQYPADIEQRIAKNLQIAYELTIEILGVLGLI